MQSKFRFDRTADKQKKPHTEMKWMKRRNKRAALRRRSKNWKKLKWIIKSEIAWIIFFKKRNQGALKFGKLLDYKIMCFFLPAQVFVWTSIEIFNARTHKWYVNDGLRFSQCACIRKSIEMETEEKMVVLFGISFWTLLNIPAKYAF